jgi:hypothetical protein
MSEAAESTGIAGGFDLRTLPMNERRVAAQALNEKRPRRMPAGPFSWERGRRGDRSGRLDLATS